MDSYICPLCSEVHSETVIAYHMSGEHDMSQYKDLECLKASMGMIGLTLIKVEKSESK